MPDDPAVRLGFAVRARLLTTTTIDARDALADRLIALIESRALSFGGTIGPETIDGYVARGDDGSATDDDRGAIASFLGNASEVADHDVGALSDVASDPTAS